MFDYEKLWYWKIQCQEKNGDQQFALGGTAYFPDFWSEPKLTFFLLPFPCCGNYSVLDR